jgi:hypothetical protein
VAVASVGRALDCHCSLRTRRPQAAVAHFYYFRCLRLVVSVATGSSVFTRSKLGPIPKNLKQKNVDRLRKGQPRGV